MQEFQELLEKVRKVHKEAEVSYKNTGKKFNIFEILDIETKETKICRFLWELL